MKNLVFILIALTMVSSSLFAQHIDHVTIVYNNLKLAEQKYEDFGFTIKHGSLHKNGVINSFVKFQDSSSLEFMSIDELAIGKMAKRYEKFIEKGDGGVYLVLSGMETDEIKKKLKKAKISCSISRNQSWDYVLLKDKKLEHIYFINYHIEINDTEEHLSHKNSTHGIKEIWVEGNEKAIELFKVIGLGESTKIDDEKYGAAEKFSTANGNIIVISEESSEAHKIRRIVFSDINNDETLRISF